VTGTIRQRSIGNQATIKLWIVTVTDGITLNPHMSQSAPREDRSAGAALPLALPPTAPATPASEPKPAPRRRPLWIVLLSVLGPGVIAAAAGNDAGGIATYSQAGAQYGLSLMWSIAVVTVGLVVVQEMCARMGAVTGKGLAALIRENFGVRVTAFAMLVLLIANFATTVSEFAGIAAVGEMFLGHRARFFVVPASVALVWLLVSRGSYQRVERILLAASAVFVTYVITAFKIGVPWKQVGLNTFAPHLAALPWHDGGLILMVVSLIGTTIAPYMQFYQQSAVRDKGVTMRDYALTRWDTVVGCVLSNVVAAFIITACAQTLFLNPRTRNIASASEAALALVPLAGVFVAKGLFAFGLLNASLMAAVIVPLSTAYAVTESLGWESGLGQRVRELPLFYGTYGVLIVASGLLILASNSNLIKIIIQAQVVNCALLPIELVLILILINRRHVMGKYRNTLWDNLVAWGTTVIAGGLALYYFAQQIWATAHPG
jgi:NRAMP (natural resistance-associated macrophage protein)-like metal ion transporter